MAGRDFGRRDQHLRSPSSKPTRADCRHGEFFRDFWQAVYGERKGVRGGRRRRGMRGTTVCTAAGRWVRSVSTVRELDRASGPLVGPVPTRLCTYTDRHRRAAASCIRAQTRPSNALCAGARARPGPCVRVVRARSRVPCVSVRARATRSRFRSVFARRGASPSVAASRPAKILARSVCSLASFSLSLAAALFGGPLSSPVEPLRHGSRSLFSVSVTPPKGSLPHAPVPPFLPRAILHFDCIAATARRLR